MTEVIEHQCARVARFLVVVTATAEPPKLSRDDLPDGGRFHLVHNRSAAHAAAAEERRGLDARAEVGWVWIGHDQFFYRSEWLFYQCFGPPDWESDQMRRSHRSQQDAVDRVLRLKKLEQEAKKVEAERKKILRAAGQKIKKHRGGDAIADGGN